MEVGRNRKTGVGFILIEETDNGAGLFVTPSCQIKPLNRRLFHDPVDDDLEVVLSRGLITEGQIEKYKKYGGDKENAFTERLTDDFEEMTVAELV